jgi:hypothetical protein
MPNLGNTTRPAYVYDAETDTWLPIGVGAHSHDYTSQFIGKTLVDAKGDIVTASANDVPAILSKGADGTILVSDSTTSTGLAWQPYGAIQVAGKNKIINGDFRVWQRGNSFSLSTGAVTFGPDRWFWVMPGGTTVSRQAFTPGSAPAPGHEGQFYVNTTLTANGQNYEIGQRVEDVRTFAGQRVTLSFWARSTAGAQPLGYALFQNFGTGGSPSSMAQATQVTGSGPYTPSSSWQRYSYTFDLPSISGKTMGTNNDSYLLVRPMQFTNTTTNTSVDIWGVQLEAGSVETPFTTATGTIQGELAACQRYYQRFTAGSANNYMASGGIAGSSVDLYMPVKLTTTMRIAPTAIDYTGLRWQIISNIGTISSAVISDANPNMCLIRCTSTGLTSTTQSYMLMTAANTDYLGFSAEL